MNIILLVVALFCFEGDIDSSTLKTNVSKNTEYKIDLTLSLEESESVQTYLLSIN